MIPDTMKHHLAAVFTFVVMPVTAIATIAILAHLFQR